MDGKGKATVSKTNANISELLGRLESHEFAVHVKAASGYRIAWRLVERHPYVRDLVKSLQNNPEFMSELVAQVMKLSARPVDPRYESPYDAMFLAILYTVREAAPKALELLSAHISRAPQLSWARRAALDLLEESTAGISWQGETQYLATGSEWITTTSDSIEDMPVIDALNVFRASRVSYISFIEMLNQGADSIVQGVSGTDELGESTSDAADETFELCGSPAA